MEEENEDACVEWWCKKLKLQRTVNGVRGAYGAVFSVKVSLLAISLSQSSTSSNHAMGEMLGNKDLGLRLLGAGIESN
ncbi:hypothetical protein VNO80_25087 [Phaseolus coccineus]|uniref:Uncharacterized protein n=1 Tax=Phaseolus coccineus TaxID=3886 RepID=A0AAN9LX62_PHACN